MVRIIKGIILNPKTDFSVEVLITGALAIDSSGKILESGDFENVSKHFGSFELVDYSNKIIMPGLIDIHTHLPQYAAIGIGNGELLPWLNDYIFPLESKFSNDEYARRSSRRFFQDMMKKGTTTAVVYTSSHFSACNIAFEEASAAGIRAFIGKTMMDINAPAELTDSAAKNIADSMALAEKWHGRGKLNYILTPRFALSCSSELLKMTGDTATSNGLFVQTHLSENRNEIELIKELYPECTSYTDVYDKSGILNDKSIFGHCIYLDTSEIVTFQNRGAVIAHCPSSNRYLASGIMPLIKYMDKGMKIGLGSDVAAGYSLSMLNEAKESVETSKQYKAIVDNHVNPITPSIAMCLATIKPAEYLKIDNVTGNFEVGKDADIAVFDLPDYLDASILLEQDYLALCLYNMNNINASAVYMGGKKVV